MDSEESLAKKDESNVLKVQPGEKEIISERTENFKKFETPDGKTRIAGAVEPIHYREDPFNTGEPLKEIDLTIRASSTDWNYSMDNNGYKARFWKQKDVNGIPVKYIAQYYRSGKWLEMAPAALIYQNASGEIQEISKPLDSGEPVIDNEKYTLTWNNVFGEGINFRYNVSQDKFFKTVIIDDKGRLPSPTISPDGLKLTVVMSLAWKDDAKTGNNFSSNTTTQITGAIEDVSILNSSEESIENPEAINYQDESGRDIFWMQKPLAWDSSESTKQIELEQVIERKESSVFANLSIPYSQLSSDEFKYPFYIDTAISEEQIPATANDGTHKTTSSTWQSTNTSISMGDVGDWEYSIADQADAWVRFTTVPIPQGATIDSASLSFRATSSSFNGDVSPNLKIRAQAEDDATLIANSATFLNRTWTTSQVNWSPATWSDNQWYSSPDVKSVVQNVTDRNGWTSNNAIGFQVAFNSGDPGIARVAYDYSSAAASSAKFNATYTEQAGPTVPGAPTGVSAVAGNASATVSFTAPVGDGGSAITGYTVTSTPGGITATGGSSPITVSGLTNGTAYTFTVHATNAIGNSAESDASASVTPITVPNAPVITSVLRQNSSFTLYWNAPVSNGGSAVTGYTITSNPGGQTFSSASTSKTMNTGFTYGVSYTFTVHATNAAGNSAESAASDAATFATIPEPPTDIVATAGNGQASIAFTPGSNNGEAITSYNVFSTPGAKSATGSSSPITVSGLTNGTTYTFQVRATNSLGTGSFSSSSNSVTPTTVPGTPTSVSATAGNGRAIVSFTAPSSTGGSAITLYTVTSTPGNITATGVSSPITISGLTNGTAYTFKVKATNATGTGLESSASSSLTPFTTPVAPTGVSATAGDREAVVYFTPPASNGGSTITSYTVTSSPGTITATGSSSPITVAGLTNDTAYTFVVKATNAAGDGESSIASVAVTPSAAQTASASTTSESTTTATATAGTPSADLTAPVAMFTSADTVEINKKITFDAKESSDNVAVSSYSWNFGDSTSGSGVRMSKEYSSPGNKIVALTVSDAAGNKATKTKTITVTPPAPILSEVKTEGRVIVLSGTAYPLSTVTVEIHSDPYIVKTQADKAGNWSVKVDTEAAKIPIGSHKIVLLTEIGTIFAQAEEALTNAQDKTIVSETKTFSLDLTDKNEQLEAKFAELEQETTQSKLIIYFGIVLIVILLTLLVLQIRKFELARKNCPK